jgi:RNA polymerase sigma-70 factor, ECF subfamily
MLVRTMAIQARAMAAPAQQAQSPIAPAERLTGMVASHHRELWRFLRHLGLCEPDVDEALQEVLLIAAEKIHDIDPERQRAFLMGTAYRVARRAREHYARRAKREAPGILELADQAPQPDQILDQVRARRLADAVLEAMPLEFRAVLVLFEVEELTTAEISDLLGIPPGTVASRLRRARADFTARVARIEAKRRFRERAP